MAYVLCYEEITNNYMQNNNIPITLEPPFFINRTGIVRIYSVIILLIVIFR